MLCIAWTDWSKSKLLNRNVYHTETKCRLQTSICLFVRLLPRCVHSVSLEMIEEKLLGRYVSHVKKMGRDQIRACSKQGQCQRFTISHYNLVYGNVSTLYYLHWCKIQNNCLAEMCRPKVVPLVVYTAIVPQVVRPSVSLQIQRRYTALRFLCTRYHYKVDLIERFYLVIFLHYTNEIWRIWLSRSFFFCKWHSVIIY